MGTVSIIFKTKNFFVININNNNCRTIHPCGYWEYVQKEIYKLDKIETPIKHKNLERFDPPKGMQIVYLSNYFNLTHKLKQYKLLKITKNNLIGQNI